MQLLTLETRDNLVKMAKPESRVNLEIKDRLEDLEGTDKMAWEVITDLHLEAETLLMLGQVLFMLVFQLSFNLMIAFKS